MSLPDHAYSDSTDMVKIIVQTVQSQDRVLKELFGHLRYLCRKTNKCNFQCLYLCSRKGEENHGEQNPDDVFTNVNFS